jgi:polyribonucleotide nucleotidyltransferase
VAGVRVGFIPSQGFIVNPTAAQMSASQLDLMMAGTADAVLMIEGFCDWLSEEQMIQVCLDCRAVDDSFAGCAVLGRYST